MLSAFLKRAAQRVKRPLQRVPGFFLRLFHGGALGFGQLAFERAALQLEPLAFERVAVGLRAAPQICAVLGYRLRENVMPLASLSDFALSRQPLNPAHIDADDLA